MCSVVITVVKVAWLAFDVCVEVFMIKSLKSKVVLAELPVQDAVVSTGVLQINL